MEVLAPIYNNLMNYLGQTEMKKFNFAIVPFIAHSIGNMAVSNHNLPVDDRFVEFLVYIVTKK